MKNFGILEFLPDNPDNFQAVNITSTGHNKRQSQNRRTQQRKQLILINTIFIQRIVSKLAFNNPNTLKLLNMPFNRSNSLNIPSARIFQPHRNRTTS